MSAGFTKLFSSIVHSTVWREPNHVRLVWVTLLALADQDGHVEASVPGLADAARVSIDDCAKAIETLSSPDPYSRTPDYDGRRIMAVSGGWVLLNYPKYRAKASKEERKEKAAERQRLHRDRKKGRDTTLPITLVTKSNDKAEAEAEANTDPPLAPPEVSHPTEPKPGRRKPKIPIPPNWAPNAAHSTKSATLGLNLALEAEKFRNNAEGRDVRWVDWDKAFHNWLANAATFTTGRAKPPGMTRHEQVQSEIDQALIDRAKRGDWGEKVKQKALAGSLDLIRFRQWLRERNQSSGAEP